MLSRALLMLDVFAFQTLDVNPVQRYPFFNLVISVISIISIVTP